MVTDGQDYGNVGDSGMKTILYAHDPGTADNKPLHMTSARLFVDVQASELPDGAATAANQTTMITALQLIDDLRNALHDVGTDELDVIVEGMVATGGEGHGLPDVFVVVAGDDGVDIHPLQLDANGYLKVIGQAGTAVVGKVRLVTAAGDEVTDETADAVKAILQTNDGVDIGNVDVASSALPTGAATSANQATALTELQQKVETGAIEDRDVGEYDATPENLTDGARGPILLDIKGRVATNIANWPSTAVIYNVTMTSANTEYSQALPPNTRKFLIKCRTSFAIKLAFKSGESGTNYLTVPAGMTYWEDQINYATVTLYFQCATAGKVAEIVAWA